MCPNVPAVKKLKSIVKSSAFNDLSLSRTFLDNCFAIRLDTPGYRNEKGRQVTVVSRVLEGALLVDKSRGCFCLTQHPVLIMHGT